MITKKDFIRQVSKTSGYTQKDIDSVLDAIRAVLIEDAKAHETVKVFNGLTMEGKLIDAHVGRNPATGEAVQIPAKTRMVYKVGQAVKAELNA